MFWSKTKIEIPENAQSITITLPHGQSFTVITEPREQATNPPPTPAEMLPGRIQRETEIGNLLVGQYGWGNPFFKLVRDTHERLWVARYMTVYPDRWFRKDVSKFLRAKDGFEVEVPKGFRVTTAPMSDYFVSNYIPVMRLIERR